MERACASLWLHLIFVSYPPLLFHTAIFEMVTLQLWCSSVFLQALAIVAPSSALKILSLVFVPLFPADLLSLRSL